MKKFSEIYETIRILAFKEESKTKFFIKEFVSIMDSIKKTTDLMAYKVYTADIIYKILENFVFLSSIPKEYLYGEVPCIEVFDLEDVRLIKPDPKINFRDKFAKFNQEMMDEADLSCYFYIDIVFAEIYEDFYGILYTSIDEKDQRIINNFVFEIFHRLQLNSWDTRMGLIIEFFNEERQKKYLSQ